MHHLTKKLTVLAFIFALILFSASWSLAGDLEPGTGPAPTMRSLQEIWDKLEVVDGKVGGSIPRTGQVESYGDRDDGELQQGMNWPEPRFTDNEDGTVTDNLTNLVWLRNADCFGPRNWDTALADANGLAPDVCDLNDGSVAGDWRLPNLRELQSLVDYGQENPALPAGDWFVGVQPNLYWTSTSRTETVAWYLSMSTGSVNSDSKTLTRYVWPVRVR